MICFCQMKLKMDKFKKSLIKNIKFKKSLIKNIKDIFF